MLIQGLQDKVKDAQRKVDLQESAMADLDEKMGELKDQVRQRQQEINEMKRTITDKANKG